MTDQKEKLASEQEAMDRAEGSREEWKNPSFLKEMFMGRFALESIEPFPNQKGLKDAEFLEFKKNLKNFLINDVDADKIDREGKIPEDIIQKLKDMGMFGLKIDKKYGGKGFSQAEYNDILKQLAMVDGNLVALISAHQSIGVPQPLIKFGTEEQKEKYLTRIAKGQISAFALTEPNVGSDPANLKTVVEDKGDHYLLNGEKLWCTNGTIADLLVVMAKHKEDDDFSAFVVETIWEGVKVEHRCHFMGLKAIENGYLSFTNVKVPKENLIWDKGRGLKLALVTLNTGRLSLPAAISGGSKKILEISREWAKCRFQWGQPIYKHEAISHKMSDIASSSFAMEALSELATALYDNGQDIRLEAAVAKLFNTEQGWHNTDELLQMRAGRGYETADSLRERGEAAIPVERMLRDFRINRIFEGTTEIMHLFIAREAVDQHLKVAGALVDGKSTFSQKVKALPGIFKFYAVWYPSLWLGWSCWPKYSEYGELAGHMRFIDSSTRKLARSIFHGMVVHGPGLQRRQMFLFRVVDIATQLYAMAASVSYAQKLTKEGNAYGAKAMSNLFCQNTRRTVKQLFKDLWFNSDKLKHSMAKEIADGTHRWMEEDLIEMTQEEKDKMVPKTMYEQKS
jgi:alkylation response protein AidB-like acyl-CoA dehydrogenase